MAQNGHISHKVAKYIMDHSILTQAVSVMLCSSSIGKALSACFTLYLILLLIRATNRRMSSLRIQQPHNPISAMPHLRLNMVSRSLYTSRTLSLQIHLENTGVLLATHDENSLVKIYRISVDWGYPSAGEKFVRGFRPHPTLSVRHEYAFRLTPQHGILTSISLLAAIRDIDALLNAKPCFLATTISLNEHDGSYSTRIIRHEVEPQVETLLPLFAQTLSNGNALLENTVCNTPRNHVKPAYEDFVAVKYS